MLPILFRLGGPLRVLRGGPILGRVVGQVPAGGPLEEEDSGGGFANHCAILAGGLALASTMLAAQSVPAQVEVLPLVAQLTGVGTATTARVVVMSPSVTKGRPPVEVEVLPVAAAVATIEEIGGAPPLLTTVSWVIPGVTEPEVLAVVAAPAALEEHTAPVVALAWPEWDILLISDAEDLPQWVDEISGPTPRMPAPDWWRSAGAVEPEQLATGLPPEQSSGTSLAIRVVMSRTATLSRQAAEIEMLPVEDPSPGAPGLWNYPLYRRLRR